MPLGEDEGSSPRSLISAQSQREEGKDGARAVKLKSGTTGEKGQAVEAERRCRREVAAGPTTQLPPGPQHSSRWPHGTAPAGPTAQHSTGETALTPAVPGGGCEQGCPFLPPAPRQRESHPLSTEHQEMGASVRGDAQQKPVEPASPQPLERCQETSLTCSCWEVRASFYKSRHTIGIHPERWRRRRVQACTHVFMPVYMCSRQLGL